MTQQTRIFHVEGMTCGGCEASLGRALGAVPGVASVAIRRPEKRVEVTGTAEPEAVLRAIAQAGFEARPAA
ncbi:MAG TPA: heavy metal-associated domain-containing protein [Ferrovibrio sp.]|uniref:heavy-metal-associated domain-containing protein n=1 Tax=Ferrovibrio sp. TaxID=1917215 RepID=UPI002B4B8735|nr:heavy metal-associated domain-containing protein [Ferrovibrio sp.]HLT77173.1 heavy metal-associated domain-containing protein [Ferrovibrio sp.]